MSAKKATEMIRYYKNPNGPTIGVTTKDVIESYGLYFKDLNGDGTLNTYKDWRKTPSERAKALAEETLKDIQNSVPEHANKKIRYPGEGTLIRRKENTELGIPVDPEIWKKICEL